LAGERWIFPLLAGVAGAATTDTFLANGLEVPRVSVIANSIRVRDRLLATGRYLAMAAGVELRFSNDSQTDIKVLPVKFDVKPRPVGIRYPEEPLARSGCPHLRRRGAPAFKTNDQDQLTRSAIQLKHQTARA
jgi:hypothetical protein